ncbi:MAG: DUF397 domain-containing protein [Pseudonocardiaceae bacterium]
MTSEDLPTTVWRKSSRSSGQNGNCVEIGFLPDQRAIRDTKNLNGATLAFQLNEWHALLNGIKSGRLVSRSAGRAYCG